MCAGAKRVGKMNDFRRVPRGFGIAGGMSAIVLFIALMVGEKFPDGRLGSVSAAVMIIIAIQLFKFTKSSRKSYNLWVL